MLGPSARQSTSRGLSVLALLSFITSFVTARVFATLNPQPVVVAGGIHFHHFWYGLVLVVFAGWMGITNTMPAHRRVYAVVFGLGAGLMGDEVGLFLTFGNYDSVLTLYFFLTVVVGAGLIVYARDRKEIEADVIGLEHSEALKIVGVAIMGFSSLFFASGLYGPAVLVVGGGLAVTLLAVAWARSSQRSKA